MTRTNLFNLHQFFLIVVNKRFTSGLSKTTVSQLTDDVTDDHW